MRPQPNILLLMTDQHRHDLMGCAGRDLVPTPHLDRLAARGLRFTHAYSASPVCVAARMSLLSGLGAARTGVHRNTDRLDWRCRTLAHHFAEHGYLTALLGKMHFNDGQHHGFTASTTIHDWLVSLGPLQYRYAEEIASHPLSPEFAKHFIDTGAGFPDQEGLWEGPSPWVGQAQRYDFSARQDMRSELPAPLHLDAFLARQTVRFFEEHRAEPWLVVASLMKPHTPLFAPTPWAERYPIDAATLPPIGRTDSYPQHLQHTIAHFSGKDRRLRQAHRAGYHANLAYVDTCIGTILEGLERLDLARDTIVIYTSDHGELDGDHGLYQKFCMFESAVRVPLIVADPRLPQARTSAALVSQLALYPTLCELAGIPAPDPTPLRPGWREAPQGLDGESIAALVRGQGDGAGPEAVYADFNLTGAVAETMVRTRRWKLVANRGGSCDELYDLEADPGEEHNRIDEPGLRGVRQDLLAQVEDWRKGVPISV